MRPGARPPSPQQEQRGGSPSRLRCRAIQPRSRRSGTAVWPGCCRRPSATASRALRRTERAAAIAALLADPIPETPANELLAGIVRRQALLFGDSLTDRRRAGQAPLPARSALRPAPRGLRRRIPAAGDLAYGEDRLVLWAEAPEGPYHLWLPFDSKRTLYTQEMAFWLEEWEALRGTSSHDRIDRQLCKDDARLVDEVTGVDGLTDVRDDAPDGRRLRRYLEPPGDLAAWARQAAATPLTEQPAALSRRCGADRLPALPRPAARRRRAAARAAAGSARPVRRSGRRRREARAAVDGGGGRRARARAFDTFRLRFVMPPPEAGEPAPLLVERALRPGDLRVTSARARRGQRCPVDRRPHAGGAARARRPGARRQRARHHPDREARQAAAAAPRRAGAAGAAARRHLRPPRGARRGQR